MVKRIGDVRIDQVILDAMDSVLINTEAAAEVLAELWQKKTDLSNNALGQAIHRLNEVKAYNLEGNVPFYERYPELYPGLKEGSKPTPQQNKQIARALEEFLYDTGLATDAEVGEGDTPRRGTIGTEMKTGKAVGGDKLYQPRMIFTALYRDAIENIMGGTSFGSYGRGDEWREWREEFSRRAEVSAEKQRITQMPVDSTPEDIAFSKKGHRISVEWLRKNIEEHLIPEAIKRRNAGKGRLALPAPKQGMLNIGADEYAAKSKVEKPPRIGRPSNQASIRFAGDDAPPRIPLGEGRSIQPKTTEIVPHSGTSILDEGFNYEPDETQARLRAQHALQVHEGISGQDKIANVDIERTKTTISHQVRASIYTNWEGAIKEMQPHGEKDSRNFKKILWNRIQESEASKSISGAGITTQRDLYDALDVLEKEGFLQEDKTIKGGKAPSNVHNGRVSKYVRPTEKGRNFKNLKSVLKINSVDDLVIDYQSYSSPIDDTTGKSKSRKTMSDFAKTMPDYGADSKLLKSIPIIGATLAALQAYFGDPDPALATVDPKVKQDTPGERAASEAARTLIPLPVDAYPVARAQLTDKYTPEEIEQMRIDQEIGQTMSPDERGSEKAAFANIKDRTLGGFLTYEPKDDRFHYRPPTP